MTEKSVAELLSREEIRTLALRYAAAVEARDVAAMAELYSRNARFGEYGEGPDGLRKVMTNYLDGSLFAVILVANHLIELQDECHAIGEVWAHCYAQTGAEGFVEQLIRYEDRYERVDGRWLFAQRRHRLWYGAAHDRSPLNQAPADWPHSQVGVGDIPLADPKFAAWWRGLSDE